MCGFVFCSKSLADSSDFKKGYDNIFHRGPDHQSLTNEFDNLWGFHRLSIMDLSSAGNQPFIYDGVECICNGEIYNFEDIKKSLKSSYEFHSESDCEVIIPLYKQIGFVNAIKLFDAEFALVLHDNNINKTFAARDPIGIRPLFYGYSKENGSIAFASEAKALINFCNDIQPFPPGYYYDGDFKLYNDIANPKRIVNDSLEDIYANLKLKLEDAVVKRLHSDAEVGFLLSGGLDSSLVCAIAQKHSNKPIRTFAVGMETDPIDLKYAKEVADFLGAEHTEVIMTKDDVLSSLKKVIWHLETWDITTIRASIGMYLVCKYIRENTNIKVLLTGEVSDEIFGYKYTDFAPSAEAFQEEAQKRIRELYMYDVLRADRCLAANSLEARVPFGDIDFVSYAMSINPIKKVNVYQKGKYLLRKAFDGLEYLPDSILMREKAAFSDAVGHSMVDYLKEFAEQQYSDSDLANVGNKYSQFTPFTKESLLYRDIFEEYYPGQASLIKDFWMPNKEWVGSEVNDPSARVLSNYGDSGK